jgi:hypothetical protein
MSGVRADRTNAAISGVTLSGFGDPFKDKSSRSSHAAHVLSGSDSYWSFQVSFVPEEKKQSWAMNLAPGFSHYTTGDDNARSKVHTVYQLLTVWAAQSRSRK